MQILATQQKTFLMYQNNVEQLDDVREFALTCNEDIKSNWDLHIDPPALPKLSYDYILSLPFVAFRDRGTLPEIGGVYFFVIKNSSLTRPIYIGSSTNIRSRIKQHDKSFAIAFLEDIELDICIAFLPLSEWDYIDIEALEVSLIRKIKPRMNKSNTGIDNENGAELLKDSIKVVFEVTEQRKQSIVATFTQPLERMSPFELRQICKDLAIGSTHGKSKKVLCRSIKTVLGNLYNESSLLTETSVVKNLMREKDVCADIDSNVFTQVAAFWQASEQTKDNVSIRQLKNIARTLRVYRYSDLTKTELMEHIEKRIKELEKISFSNNTTDPRSVV